MTRGSRAAVRPACHECHAYASASPPTMSVAPAALAGLTLPITMKKANIATMQIAATQKASRIVRVDSLTRPGCGRGGGIRTFLRIAGLWIRRADRSSGGGPRARGPRPLQPPARQRRGELLLAADQVEL